MASPDWYWQDRLREELRLDGDLTIPGRDLEEEIRDYLDHHGELARTMHEIAETPDSARVAREILHKHQLVIALLLERVEAIDIHRVEADFLAGKPPRVAAVG